MITAEEKNIITSRLLKEGRWRYRAAMEYKESERLRLKWSGKDRKEAVEEAWENMSEKFPPLGENEVNREEYPLAVKEVVMEELDEGLEELLGRLEFNRCTDLTGDILWVYENLENVKVRADKAPGCGAWALLKWARQYRNRFFEQVLPKAKLDGVGEDGGKIKEEEKSIEELKRVLARMNENMN